MATLACCRWRLLDEVVLQAALHPDRVAARSALLLQAAVQQFHAHRPRRCRAPDQVEHAVAAMPECIGRQRRIALQGQLAVDQVRAPQIRPVVGIADEATVQVQRIDAPIGTYHGVKTGAGEIGGIAAQAAAAQRAEQQQIAFPHRGRATELRATGKDAVTAGIAVVGQIARHDAQLQVAPVTLHARDGTHIRQSIDRRHRIAGTGQLSVRVFGGQGQGVALAQCKAVMDAGHQQVTGAAGSGKIQRVGQAIRVHEAGVTVTRIRVAKLAIGMAQAELIAIAAAEEVILQIEAQVAMGGRPPRLETETRLLGVDVEVRDVAMVAAHRHRRGNELILVPCAARIRDRIELGIATDADHGVGAGNGEEAFQVRIGRAGGAVRARGRR